MEVPPGTAGAVRAGPEGRVVAIRGDAVESVHRFHAVVATPDGPVAEVGDGGHLTWLRSASKPFQALPLVEDGVLERFGFGAEELAVACGSHNAEPEHVAVVRRMLAGVGLSEAELGCGGHWPLKDAAARRFLRRGRLPGPVDSNCSGKHAGMLALARFHGWSPEGYLDPAHPVQRRMLRESMRWTGVPEEDLVTGVDGCGVVCFAVPLRDLAAAYARFGAAAARGEGPEGVCAAMVAHPFLVAGTERLCTLLMEAAPGVVAKVGAEGVYGAAVPGSELGIAVKVEDGGWRAVEPALLAVLEAMEVLDAPALEALQEYRAPVRRNTRGDAVGRLEVDLQWPGGRE